MNENLRKEQKKLDLMYANPDYTEAEILKQSQVVDKLMAEEMERMNGRG